MLRPAIVLTLVLTGSAGLLPAQRRPSSSSGGLWYAIGVAPGWARVTCRICAGHRETGISGFVALGGRTSRALRLGGELAGWRQGEAGLTQTVMAFGAAAYWYPGTDRRLYLRGGATWLTHRINDGNDVVTSSEIGPQLGVGYEHQLSSHWHIAPFIHYAIGVFGGDVKFNGGQAAGSARVSLLQLGISLTRR